MLSAVAAAGAVFSDFLGLAVALKNGDVLPDKFKRTTTYMGLALYGLLAGLLVIVLGDHVITGKLGAFSVGFNLPAVLEKLAKLLPKVEPASDPEARSPGPAPAPPVPMQPGSMERVRRFVAKEA